MLKRWKRSSCTTPTCCNSCTADVEQQMLQLVHGRMESADMESAYCMP